MQYEFQSFPSIDIDRVGIKLYPDYFPFSNCYSYDRQTVMVELANFLEYYFIYNQVAVKRETKSQAINEIRQYLERLKLSGLIREYGAAFSCEKGHTLELPVSILENSEEWFCFTVYGD